MTLENTPSPLLPPHLKIIWPILPIPGFRHSISMLTRHPGPWLQKCLRPFLLLRGQAQSRLSEPARISVLFPKGFSPRTRNSPPWHTFSSRALPLRPFRSSCSKALRMRVTSPLLSAVPGSSPCRRERFLPLFRRKTVWGCFMSARAFRPSRTAFSQD